MAKLNKIRIASLFSGCGGLDLGFLGGFTFEGKKYKKHNTIIVFANDIDADAVTCYNSNHLLSKKGNDCRLADIRDVNANEIPNFDVLLAGFPCQPFSNAGNRKGIQDDNGRGTLFEECERILKDKVESGNKPKAFVFENVRGIISSKMPSGISVPDEIKHRMEKLGYNVSMQLVVSSDYGVPQNRYRFLIIGVDKNIGSFDFNNMAEVVEKESIPSVNFGKSEKLLLGYILKDVRELPDNEYWKYSESTQKMIEDIGPCEHSKEAIDFFKTKYSCDKIPDTLKKGRSWKDVPYEKLSPRFRKIYDNPSKYHAPKFYRRFALGEINGTITASAQPENCGITHPFENRRFSVREVARIQSFPDDYIFNDIPLQARYKVIGNAVPPVMAWVIAKALLDYIV